MVFPKYYAHDHILIIISDFCNLIGQYRGTFHDIPHLFMRMHLVKGYFLAEGSASATESDIEY